MLVGNRQEAGVAEMAQSLSASAQVQGLKFNPQQSHKKAPPPTAAAHAYDPSTGEGETGGLLGLTSQPT